jgi:hypothetical protein
MDRQPTFLNQLVYCLDTNFARISNFKGTSGVIATIKHGKNQGVKKPAVFIIKRTIDEHAQLIVIAHSWLPCHLLDSFQAPALRLRTRSVEDATKPAVFLHDLVDRLADFRDRDRRLDAYRLDGPNPQLIRGQLGCLSGFTPGFRFPRGRLCLGHGAIP